MARVICTHRHASGSINGVSFEAHTLGRISEELSEEQAEGFLAIPGYVSEDGIAHTKFEATQELQHDIANFMPSSFADQHPQMQATLQDTSPGWEKKEGDADGGGNEKNAPGAGPATLPKAIARPATKK
jgi:hypothetical protein